MMLLFVTIGSWEIEQQSLHEIDSTLTIIFHVAWQHYHLCSNALFSLGKALVQKSLCAYLWCVCEVCTVSVCDGKLDLG